jgi:hypothetical protein
MAFPNPPRTWSAGETLTAANFNAQIRDAFLATPHLLAYKSADESLTSNTTLQDDNHLFFAMTANDLWYVRLVLWVSGGNDSNIKIAFTLPSGSMMLAAVHRDTSNVFQDHEWLVSTTPQNLRSHIAGSIIDIKGTVTNGGTPGNFQMQWAQAASVGVALVVTKGSTIQGMKLN